MKKFVIGFIIISLLNFIIGCSPKYGCPGIDGVGYGKPYNNHVNKKFNNPN